MLFHFSPVYFFHYFLKRKTTQFFTSIAIRSFALGMVLIFEPIYLYSYFNQSLSFTLLFFGAIYGLYALIAVYGGRIMAKLGLRRAMLFSHFFFFAYYLSLFFIYQSFIFIPLAIILKVIGIALFWPAFHIDFARFSEKGYQGQTVGKMNIVYSIPTVVSPIIGGIILAAAGYPALFITVLAVLLASSIPGFLSKESHIIYIDSYKKAWQRIFKKENRKTSLAFIADALETSVSIYLWPLFMFVLAISYTAMGGIITFALGIGVLFTLYMGKISDKLINRVWFLNIGSVLTSISWIIKYFVVTPFDAFLAHTLYRICRSSASIPFQTFFYKKVSLKGHEADEFIIYREILVNLSSFFFFFILAGLFFFIPHLTINVVFIMAAVISLGFMFLGVPPKLKW